MKPEGFVLSTAYCPPISYISKFNKGIPVYIETKENFLKQTFRNRCEIASANGKLTLSVPLVKKHSSKTNITEIRIDYSEDWQKNHFKALESAYRNSPFFEYYFDEFAIFFKEKTETLFELNQKILQKVLSILRIEQKALQTNVFISNYDDLKDFRNIINPKRNSLSNDPYFASKKYYQVFSEKFGFIENLSIFDLIFNMGNESIEYL